MSRRRSHAHARKERKKIFALFVFIIILIFIIVVAWYLASRPTPTGTLVIHVVDVHTSNPIGGAIVTIYVIENTYAASGQTNELGVYMFESIPAGTDYRVVAAKEGYHEHPAETASVEAGKTTHHTVRLHMYH